MDNEEHDNISNYLEELEKEELQNQKEIESNKDNNKIIQQK